MAKAKYIKTKGGEIIVFGEIMQHRDFRYLDPISAGFIYFGGKDELGNPSCECIGKSISLRLEADEEDTFLAQRQLGFRYY